MIFHILPRIVFFDYDVLYILYILLYRAFVKKATGKPAFSENFPSGGIIPAECAQTDGMKGYRILPALCAAALLLILPATACGKTAASSPEFPQTREQTSQSDELPPLPPQPLPGLRPEPRMPGREQARGKRDKRDKLPSPDSDGQKNRDKMPRPHPHRPHHAPGKCPGCEPGDSSDDSVTPGSPENSGNSGISGGGEKSGSDGCGNARSAG